MFKIMHDIYFQDSQGEQAVIGECSNRQELWQVVTDFLEEHGYDFSYCQAAVEETDVKIDFGSDSEFFFVNKVVFEEAENN